MQQNFNVGSDDEHFEEVSPSFKHILYDDRFTSLDSVLGDQIYYFGIIDILTEFR
jgi:hypothetical protein